MLHGEHSLNKMSTWNIFDLKNMLPSCLGTVEKTYPFTHAVSKLVFLCTFVILVVFWPSVSLITLACFHVLLACILSMYEIWNSSSKMTPDGVKYIQYHREKRYGVDDTSGFAMLDRVMQILVFQFENKSGSMVTLNILYIIVILANFNYFFSYQGDITPPTTLVAMMRTPVRLPDATMKISALQTEQNHLLFQEARSGSVFGKYITSDSYWKAQPLAEQVRGAIYILLV